MLVLLLSLLLASIVEGEQIDSCWTTTKSHRIMGLANTPASSTEDCCRKCEESTVCNVIDWYNTSKEHCWIQTKPMVVSASVLLPKESVTNMILDRGCLSSNKIAPGNLVSEQGPSAIGESDSCWTTTKYHHIIGLANTPASSIEDCCRQCEESTVCNVIDWDVNTNPNCWIQTGSMEVSISLLEPMDSVTDMILDRGCLNSKSIEPGNLVSEMELSPIGEKDSCWTTTKSHRIMGLANTPTSSIQDCCRQCEESTVCNVIDWYENSKEHCWIQTKPIAVSTSVLLPMGSVTNMILDRGCLSSKKIALKK